MRLNTFSWDFINNVLWEFVYGSSEFSANEWVLLWLNLEFRAVNQGFLEAVGCSMRGDTLDGEGLSIHYVALALGLTPDLIKLLLVTNYIRIYSSIYFRISHLLQKR
jgi:hypothetical protein